MNKSGFVSIFVFQINSPSLMVIIHIWASRNSGTPKWMVKIMEDPIKMDDLGEKNPSFSETSIYIFITDKKRLSGFSSASDPKTSHTKPPTKESFIEFTSGRNSTPQNRGQVVYEKNRYQKF